MIAYDIRRWEARLTTFLRSNRRMTRACRDLWRRKPTLSKRRHWHAVARALEDSRLHAST
jgi:hypothetical protein